MLALACVALAGPARAEVGVTDREVVLGEPAAFSGPSAGLGVETWRGATAAFAEANARGGVHGRRIRLEIADDGYEAERAMPAVLELLDRGVFCLFGGVGTPTLVRVLPVLLEKHESEDLFYFASFTGADPQREQPYRDAVFNIRASYRQETAQIVEGLLARGYRRLAVFAQNDAYGVSGREGVRQALGRHGAQIASDTTYTRGHRFEQTTEPQLALMRQSGAEAIVAIGTYQATAALVRDARAGGWEVPIVAISFTGADQILDLLRAEGRRTGRDLTAQLFSTQVVPPYDDLSLKLVREYQAAMERFAPVRAPIGDGSYVATAPHTYASFEGYLNARAFLHILERTGPELTRGRFHRTAERMGRFELGMGEPLAFSPTRHQALDRVWILRATPVGWSPAARLLDVLPPRQGGRACDSGAC